MSGRVKNVPQTSGSPGAVYALGFIGAVIYFFQNAEGFWNFVLGFLEAIVWPAVLIHKVFEALKVW